MDMKKIIAVIGLVLFWGIWAYGFIALVLSSDYGASLRAAKRFVMDFGNAEQYQIVMEEKRK